MGEAAAPQIGEVGTYEHLPGTGPATTTLHFTLAYDPAEFDGLLLARYRHRGHKELPLLSQRLA
jgi:hypothetical protein